VSPACICLLATLGGGCSGQSKAGPATQDTGTGSSVVDGNDGSDGSDGTDSGTPAVTVASNTLNFGEVRVGQSSTLYVELFNDGNEEFVFEVAEMPDSATPFDVDYPAAVAVAPGARYDLPVHFTPVTAGEIEAQLHLAVGGTGETIAVGLLGTGLAGVASLSPSEQDWGTVEVMCPTSGTVSLTNVGNLPLQVLGFDLTDSGAAGAVFDHGSVSFPATLSPASSLTTAINALPTAVGEHTVWVDIRTDDPYTPRVTAVVGFLAEYTGDHLHEWEESDGVTSRFYLSADPIAGTLTVLLDGVPQHDGWTLDATGPAIVFDPSAIPAAGRTVEWQYDVWGECPAG
jgi:hypothetical protein